MRYISTGTNIPQPIRKIIESDSDIFHTLKLGERLDNLAQKYYDNPLLSWVIMAGNPEFESEWEIKPGTMLRIPYPLERVFNSWLVNNEI